VLATISGYMIPRYAEHMMLATIRVYKHTRDVCNWSKLYLLVLVVHQLELEVLLVVREQSRHKPCFLTLFSNTYKDK
jgi:hypothetical protein